MKEVRKVDVMSVAKIHAAFGAILGLITGIAMTAITASVGMLGMAVPVAGVAMMFGALSIIIMPILYGIGGFVVGAICAFLYNIIASKVGGIVIELK
jgi:hypothetical protein